MDQDRGSGHVKRKCTIRIKDLKKFKAILVFCAFARHQRAKIHTAFGTVARWGVIEKRAGQGLKLT